MFAHTWAIVKQRILLGAHVFVHRSLRSSRAQFWEPSSPIARCRRRDSTMVQHIINEIGDARRFLSGREKTTGPDSMVTLRKSLADSLAEQISAHKGIAASDAAEMQSALQPSTLNSPFDESDTARICAALDAKLELALNDVRVGRKDSNKQSMKIPWAYTTTKGWSTTLNNKRTGWSAKMTLIVERILAVGCCNPDEQTLKKT